MMAARVQALIGVAGETITYKRVTHGSYSTATLQSSPSVQSYAIKAGVWQYRARDRGVGPAGRPGDADRCCGPEPYAQAKRSGRDRRQDVSGRVGQYTQSIQ
jgi:hypothetical protein